MEIRPIRTEADHFTALKEIERLWSAEDGTLEADTLEVLAILVEDYESRYSPVPTRAPTENLKYATAEMGRSQKDLADLLGSRSHASEVLSGRRLLTTAAVSKISKAWHIPAELLIAPYEGDKAA
jgi:HTH-type transcriptional regulator / antitoxin HigA